MNLAAWLIALCAVSPSQSETNSPPQENFGFTAGTLAGWDGEGFELTSGKGKGPSLQFGVTSRDNGAKGNTGLLHLTFQVPPNAGVIRFRAYAARGKDMEGDGNLDVILMGANRYVVPKQVLTSEGWKRDVRLLPPRNGQTREYLWNVASYVGQTLRIVLIDDDPRPGCHVYCTGFRVLPADEFEINEFSTFMNRLVREHRLPPVTRFESKHFIALSNADDPFTERRLHNCELLYDLFFDYFGRRGFRVRQPAGKMMVAIFDSQSGYEAYAGFRLGPAVVGLYYRDTNRLVVYDYGQNSAHLEERQRRQAAAKSIRSDLHRRRFIETTNRRLEENRTEANISTIMHEVAHQLSFNCGLLNRDGDVPLWLAEGLACFCEATANGSWQGIGELNPERVESLTAPIQGRGRLLSLNELINGDEWIQPKPNKPSPVLGYAQSWALFRMLMQERPAEMRHYLSLIYTRRTPDYRLADFTRAFGTDLSRLELRYQEYMKELVERSARR